MNHIPSDHLVSRPPIAVSAATAASARLIWLAWIATLLLSNLPLIIARDVLGGDIPWITPLWLGTATLLFAATYVRPLFQPLRRYFALMGVLILLNFWLHPLVLESAAWQRLFAGRSEMAVMFGGRVFLLLRTLVALLAVMIMGLGRRQAFLTPGNLTAPVQGLSLPGGRRLNWAVLGAIAALLLAGFFYLVLTTQMAPGAGGLAAAVPWLPLILVGAALNAFGEEAMYRAAPLATLLPAIGARHAIWMTAVWFGLGHYYGGVPSGLAGLIGPGLLALLLGKAMLDTRGMGWSWIIHAAIDTVIYTTMAMSLP